MHSLVTSLDADHDGRVSHAEWCSAFSSEDGTPSAAPGESRMLAATDLPPRRFSFRGSTPRGRRERRHGPPTWSRLRGTPERLSRAGSAEELRELGPGAAAQAAAAEAGGAAGAAGDSPHAGRSRAVSQGGRSRALSFTAREGTVPSADLP